MGCSEINHHNLAIELQRRRSIGLLLGLIKTNKMLIEQSSIGKLLSLHNSIFDYLRSKIFPEKTIDKFTEDLFHTFICQNRLLEFYCILAESTALKEVNDFINFVNICNWLKHNIKIHFILVNWPSIDTNFKPLSTNQSLLNTRDKIFGLLDNKVLGFELHLVSPWEEKTLNSHIDPLFCHEFQQMNHQIKQIYVNKIKGSLSLKNDINWIEKFYKRQVSLSRLAPTQAIFDLSIRRSLGVYVARKFDEINKEKSKSAYYVITSELNKRFLKCYKSQSSIINIFISENIRAY